MKLEQRIERVIGWRFHVMDAYIGTIWNPNEPGWARYRQPAGVAMLERRWLRTGRVLSALSERLLKGSTA